MNIEQYERNKEIIINTLKEELDGNSKLLNYFGINEENFSKSLRTNLEKFAKEIKFNKNIFATIEGDKLFFLSKNDNEENIKLLKQLEIVKRNISSLNLKMKIAKEKINNENKLDSYNINSITACKFEKEENSFKLNYEFVINKIKEVFSEKKVKFNKSESNSEFEFNPNEEKLNQIDQLKTEIVKLNKSNLSLKNEKSEMEKKVNKFINMPSDINKIKEMIKMKKEEYASLSNKNINMLNK